MRLRRLLVEGPGSVGERLRRRRWDLMLAAFPGLDGFRVLDLGGTAGFWARAPHRPASVTVVNLVHDLPGPAPGPLPVRCVTADACTFRTAEPFDLVVSNSLLEHVGGYARRRQLAAAVLAAAPRHWVQTPYRYFPLEPHWLFPGMQFLPVAARAVVARRWPLAHSAPPDHRAAVEEVLSTELVGRTELAHLLPGSRVVVERVLGLPKSLIAVAG
ncbi:MAG: methyltransferase type 11 [Kineosporiaceae bacterium]